MRHLSRSPAETFDLGAALGKQVLPGALLLLFGELGAGKTAFIKGFVQGVLGDSSLVTSPTFTYLNIYKAADSDQQRIVYHFDLYRLGGIEEFLSMGFDEFLDAGGFSCIEWADKLGNLPLPGAIHVRIEPLEGDMRSISMDLMDLDKMDKHGHD